MSTFQNDHEEAFSLRSLLSIIFKRRGIILSCLTVCGAIGVSISFFMTPVFQAKSTVLLEKETATEKAVLLRLNLPRFDESYDWINAEIKIMESYPVAVLAYLSLHKSNKHVDSTGAFVINRLRMQKEIMQFQENLEIMSARNSNVVEISYQHESPAFAAKAVEQIINIYIKHRADISKGSEAYRFFEKQLQAAGDRLKQLEERQFAFKQKQQVLLPEQQNSILLNQLANFQKSLAEVRTSRISKQARLDVIKKQMENGKNINIPTTETSNSPSRERYIARLKGDLFTLELQYSQLKLRFARRYSDVVQLEKQIREVKLQIAKETNQIVQSEEMAIQALRAEEQELQATINNIKNDMRDFSKKEFAYNQISRDINDSEEVYSMLLKQREQARISLSKLEREIKIKTISPAIVGKDPLRPRKKLYIALSMLFGTAFGLSLALGLEFFDHTISSPEALEKYTGLPSLGAVSPIHISMAQHQN